MVGSAQKNWPPYLAAAEAAATEIPADAGDASELPGESSLVVELNCKHEEVALGPGLECFWFPDATHFFLLEWPKCEGDAPRPPPGFSEPGGNDEGRDTGGHATEEKQTGKSAHHGPAC